MLAVEVLPRFDLSCSCRNQDHAVLNLLLLPACPATASTRGGEPLDFARDKLRRRIGQLYHSAILSQVPSHAHYLSPR